MTAFVEKHRKVIFWILVGAAFVTIYVFNLLTPYMSDDYSYLCEVRNANSIMDLIKQQYGEYLSNSGRIIGQFNIRLSLMLGKQVFNVVNSVMFVALALLMYGNIRRRKSYDLLTLFLILTFLWSFSVEFGQTMLWICGACNYLWGSVIILSFITFYRYKLEHAEAVRHPVLLAVGCFLWGVPAGWCNENTSGGAFLLLLLLGLNFWWSRRKAEPLGSGKTAGLRGWFWIAGLLGMCCGMLGMVMAPGIRNRSVVMAEDEGYTGIVGLLSRTYKMLLNLRDLFLPVLIILMVVLVLLFLQKKLDSRKQIRESETVLFLVAAAATAGVIALIPTPANRAYFGAGVFLFIACIQGIVDVADSEPAVRAAKYALVSILCLCLFFTYLEGLVNLARIYREEQERVEIIKADKADPNGDGIVVVAKLREEFATPFSNLHASDLEDDKEYWINLFYEIYYDVGNIRAVPRDEWEEQYGGPN